MIFYEHQILQILSPYVGLKGLFIFQIVSFYSKILKYNYRSYRKANDLEAPNNLPPTKAQVGILR